MIKVFVVDTSVLLYDLDCLFKFDDNMVVIPSVVMEELDKFKEEASERGYSARKILEVLDCIAEVESLNKGVHLSEVPKESPIYERVKGLNTFIKKSYKVKNTKLENVILTMNNDAHIIACAINHDAILVSRDRSMRLLAKDFVKAEDYKADRIKTREIYKGYRKELVSEDIINKLYEGLIPDTFNLHPNEFIILENEINPNHVGIGIKKRDGIKCCDFKNLRTKTKPMNLEQKLFLYLLNDEEIRCVTATGVSGKGKSLLAVDFALSRIESNDFHKLLYTKPIIPLDKNEYLGYMKGDMHDKMKPHLQPLYCSIEFLMRKQACTENKMRISVDMMVDKYIEEDTLNFCPLADIRGMSIFNKVVVLDEGQNTTNHVMKTLVTRVADTSKLIILGDIEQIDDRNLNKFNNGLSHLVEEGKDEYFIGHICMDIDNGSRRGKLAEFGSKRL